jgi:GT2 family glycosyltransferase
MIKVQISSPSYDGRVQSGVMTAIMLATKNDNIHVQLRTADCSSLTRVFNTLWAGALNDRKNGLTHFAMIHDDVCPEPLWLDKMFALMESKKADVLSAIIPLKTTEGLTSTAFDERLFDGTLDDHYRIRSITIREAFKMDPTFTAKNILLNTGLMLIDFRKQWVENIAFRFEDEILFREEKFVVRQVSEDWAFSRDAVKHGASLWATREVKVKHIGRAAYTNEKEWGK